MLGMFETDSIYMALIALHHYFITVI